MKLLLLSLLSMFIALPLLAQKEQAAADMKLQPYKISSVDIPFKRKLHFAGYKTHHFRRNIASWFSFGTLNIANQILKIDGVPLYKKSKHRSVDIFSFAMKTDAGIVSHTECRAVLRKNETFSIFRPKDSSFFKIKNADYLDARIRTDDDTSHIWYLAAANLNGSVEAEQQGILRCGDSTIYFVKTMLLLRDQPVSKNEPGALFTSLNQVYLFTYNNETIAAVSFKLSDKLFWCRDDLDSNLKTIVASAASLLCMRNDLYY